MFVVVIDGCVAVALTLGGDGYYSVNPLLNLTSVGLSVGRLVSVARSFNYSPSKVFCSLSGAMAAAAAAAAASSAMYQGNKPTNKPSYNCRLYRDKGIEKEGSRRPWA